MPLTMANPGECYTIRKVGGKEETRRFHDLKANSRTIRLFPLRRWRKRDSRIGNRRQSHRECERFQGGRWKRYGSQNPDLIGKKERR